MMNAYELAKELDKYKGIATKQASDMLRQQADRIAELEKLVSDMAYEKASGVYDRPQTKHEPVAWVSAYQLAKYWENEAVVMSKTTANMLRQQADCIAELESNPRQLSDEELNKAFDYYCETDEGVLRFNYELRDKWKKEQLIRWKEAFKKASEK